MKKIIIAPDSFKGTLSSIEVCKIIKSELVKLYPYSDIIEIPLADGGEGTCDAFYHSLGGKIVHTTVKSPLARNIASQYLMLENGTAIIEMAKASGITIEKENNALTAGSYGTGQLILHALNAGAKKIILGIGGSATTDGGTGCMAALGVKFKDENNNEIYPCGKTLNDIKAIDTSALDKRLKNTDITVLCDVDNPLYGKNGAAFVFSPQKGAKSEDVVFLDNGLQNLANVFRTQFSNDYSSFPGSGAAGGMGFAMLSFLSAKLKSGIDCVLDTADFDTHLKNCELIITGEGRMDKQSLMGKVPFGVAKRGQGTKVIAVVGICELKRDEYQKHGIYKVIETNEKHLPFEEIKDKAEEMLKSACKGLKSV